MTTPGEVLVEARIHVLDKDNPQRGTAERVLDALSAAGFVVLARADLEALITDWSNRRDEYDDPSYYRGEGKESCADELREVLGKST